MKKIIICLMLVISLMMMATSFAASVNVQINGEMIDFTDANGNKVEAQTINSRTMVPLRKIFEVLNCDIDWDGTTKTVTAKQKDKTIILQIDNKIATIKDKTLNKEEEITLDSEPIIFENRTLVPLRFIGESLGKTVAWDAGNKTAIIIDYDELAKIIQDKCSSLINASVFEISHCYYDDATPANNSVSTYTFTGKTTSDGYQVDMDVAGNSEMAKDFASEEWNKVKFTLNNDGTFVTDNYVFSSMLGIKKNERVNWNFENYGLSKNKNSTMAEYVKAITNVDSSSININTYKELKEDLTKLSNTFLSGSNVLNVSSFAFNHIDFNNILKARTSDAISGAMLLNQMAFRFSVEPEDIFEEFISVNYSFSNDQNGIKITINLKNDYKERDDYIIIIK